MRKQLSPIAAITRGLVAGVVGSAIQNLFFRLTARFAPAPPSDAFQPPEPDQVGETPAQTAARRLASLGGRGPLSARAKVRGARLVHYGFGSLWGAVYGIVRESLPGIKKPLGVAGFGTAVWLVSDNLMLPAFRLAAWPRRYPLRTHAYAWLAHVKYSSGVALGYELLRRRSGVAALAGAWLMRKRRRIARHLPRALRPPVAAVFRALSPPLQNVARLATTAVRL